MLKQLNDILLFRCKTLHKVFSFSLFITLYIGCKHGTKQEFSAGKYFQYYDIISLEGKEPLDNSRLKFPFISIETNKKNKKITHYFSRIDSFQSNYTINDNNYEREIFEGKNNSKRKIQEIIQNDSIIVISEEVIQGDGAVNIGIYSHDTLTLVGFLSTQNKNWTRDSVINYINFSKEGVKSRYIYSQEMGEVTVHCESMYMNNPKPFYSKIFKFKNTSNSLNWWLIFKWKYYSNSIFDSPENLIELGVNKENL